MKTLFLVSILCLSCIQGELNLDDVVYTSVSFKGIDISVWKDGDKFYMMPLGILKPNSLKVTNSTFAGFKPRFKYTLILMTKNAKMLTLNHLRKLTGKCVKMEEIQIVPFTHIDVSVSVNLGFEMKHSWSFDFSQHPATISPSLICLNVVACDMWRAAFGQDPIIKLDYRIGNETKVTTDARILNDNTNSTDATLVKEVQCKTFSERKLEEIGQLIKSTIPFLKSIANNTSILRVQNIQDCGQFVAESSRSGIFYSTIPGKRVYCDMSTGIGGWTVGWTVLTRRLDNTVKFYERSWEEYKNGFGDLNGNFWLGNEAMHQLTFDRRMKVRVDLWLPNNTHMYGEWDNFKIASESDKYKMTFDVDSYKGNYNFHEYGASFRFLNDRIFSIQSCGGGELAGWWYSGCTHFSLIYKYGSNGLPTVDQRANYIKRGEIKIRPM